MSERTFDEYEFILTILYYTQYHALYWNELYSLFRILTRTVDKQEFDLLLAPMKIKKLITVTNLWRIGKIKIELNMERFDAIIELIEENIIKKKDKTRLDRIAAVCSKVEGLGRVH